MKSLAYVMTILSVVLLCALSGVTASENKPAENPPNQAVPVVKHVDKLIRLDCKTTNKYSDDNREVKYNTVHIIDPDSAVVMNDKSQILRHFKVEFSDYFIKMTCDLPWIHEVIDINRMTGEVTGNGHVSEGPIRPFGITGECVKIDKLTPKF